MSTVYEVALVAVLIVANGLFSGSETAVVSARRARLQERAGAGDEKARKALELANDPNTFLSTTQIGITLIGILSGAFGGAALAHPASRLVARIPGLEHSANTIAFALVVLVITYLSLVVGELVPKRIALNNPERIAASVAGPMQRLSRVVRPVVHLLSGSTDALLRLLRVQKNDDPVVTEAELNILLEQGARAGIFHPSEHLMTQRVFDLADDRISILMTPRPEVDWIDVEETGDDIARMVQTSRFSRFPVGRGSIDRVEGVVDIKEILQVEGSAWTFALPKQLPKPLVVPESSSVLHALERFRHAGEQMAIVIDEYGGTAGIVTLTDILEAIVGELPGAGEIANAGAVQRDDGSWLLDGRLPIDEVRDLLDLPLLPGEDEGIFETLAGFVISEFGNLPAIGDHIAWSGWIFEVIDMDGRRVDRVLARRAAAEPD